MDWKLMKHLVVNVAVISLLVAAACFDKGWADTVITGYYIFTSLICLLLFVYEINIGPLGQHMKDDSIIEVQRIYGEREWYDFYLHTYMIAQLGLVYSKGWWWMGAAIILLWVMQLGLKSQADEQAEKRNLTWKPLNN